MRPKGVICDFSFPLTAEQLVKKADDLIARCRLVYNKIGSLNPSEITKENFLQVLANVQREYYVEQHFLDFPQHTSPDKSLRDASTEVVKKMDEFVVEISMHQGIFNNLLALQNTKPQLTREEQRFLEKHIKLGKQNGLHLSQEIQDQVKALKTQINELSLQFSKNLNDENTVLEFSEEELKGLPNDFINNLDKADSRKRKVTLKYPHYFPIMRKARIPQTRKTIEEAFSKRCMNENTKILEELVSLRHTLANLLGYSTHAAYATDFLMAKSAEAVRSFLEDVGSKLRDNWTIEKSVLLDFKEKECAELGLEYNKELNIWDTQYYTTMVKEKLYAVDQEKLKEYFSLAVVREGLLQIYQDLLSLKFEKIENPQVWHPDVEMFRVTDVKSGVLMGYFFLDLFPRESKYGHAAIFELQPGCLLADGRRQVGVCSMVANFTKPTTDKPSLLDHQEVVTFFHEFGHIMHYLCAQPSLAYFNSFNVERDFVEAPSQMLENWCWEAESLRRMSGHYQDGTPLPENMLEALVRSRKANVAYGHTRQIVLGLFDHIVHTTPQADTCKVFADVSINLSGIKPSVGTNFAAGFQHMVIGYDAKYYGYMWSEVFSMDMYASRFKKEGIMNPAVGMEYRQKILVPGSSKDGSDLLVDFLGRKPNDDAFLDSIGLKS